MSQKTSLNNFHNGIVGLLEQNILPVICNYLKSDKNVNVSVEDMMKALKIESQSTVSMSNNPIPTYLQGKRSVDRKTQMPNGNQQCHYRFRRGKKKGEQCPGTSIQHGYCNACLKKKAVKEIIESKTTNSFQNRVYPPNLPDAQNSQTSSQEQTSESLNVEEIKERPGYYRDTEHGFIIQRLNNGDLYTSQIYDHTTGQYKELNQSDKELAYGLGLCTRRNDSKSSQNHLPILSSLPNRTVSPQNKIDNKLPNSNLLSENQMPIFPTTNLIQEPSFPSVSGNEVKSLQFPSMPIVLKQLNKVSSQPLNQTMQTQPSNQSMRTQPSNQTMQTQPPSQSMQTQPPNQSMKTQPPNQSMQTKPSTPSSGAAPPSAGSNIFLMVPNAGFAKAAPAFVRKLLINSSRRVSISNFATASLDLSKIFPVKPSMTTTSTCPPNSSLLSTLPMKFKLLDSRSGLVSLISWFPFPVSSPFDSKPRRGFSIERTF